MQSQEPGTSGAAPKKKGATRKPAIDLSAEPGVIDATTPDTPEPIAAPRPKPKPRVDWLGEIELKHIALKFMALSGTQAMTLGGHVATGFDCSGVVRRMTRLADGTVRVLVEVGASAGGTISTGNVRAVLVRDWHYGEVDYSHYSDENEGTVISK